MSARLAVEMGYENVYWYQEGIKGWKKSGNPTSFNLKLSTDNVPPIKPADLALKIKDDKRIVLVDVRDEKSIEKFGEIKGNTVHCPLFRLHSLYQELPKNRFLVIYDIKGIQAPIATRLLLMKSFDPEKITWLAGGIQAWNQTYPPAQEKR
jgi:rhodanese-related sulfurtransferase